MKKKEINKKYNIKMILDEMYVWDDDFKEGSVLLVLFYDTESVHKKKYHALVQEGGFACVIDYTNAITLDEYEEKIKLKIEPEPEFKIGDYGYFWNDNLEIKYFFYGKLKFIFDPTTTNYRFKNEFDHCLQHFSKTRPEWANNL